MDTLKGLFVGNLLLIICCVFYLAWWIIAFKPYGAVRGMASGWLLFPAALTGLAAIFVLIHAFRVAETDRSLVPGTLLMITGVVAYFILLAITYFCMHRVVTTELLLIVGWCVLALSEVNVLYGIYDLSVTGAWIWFIAVIAASAVSMVCYILYYGLNDIKGYVDGMVPLLIIGGMMAVMSIGMLFRNRF